MPVTARAAALLHSGFRQGTHNQLAQGTQMTNWKRAVAIAALTLTMPLHALAAGAIAVDDEDRGEAGYGWVIGAKTMDDAGPAAMAECFEGGNKACRVALRFEACGAYAASWRFSNAGRGATKAEAIANALKNCKDCRVVVADCETASFPQSSPNVHTAASR